MGKGEKRERFGREEGIIMHGGGGFEVIHNERDAYIGCYSTWPITRIYSWTGKKYITITANSHDIENLESISNVIINAVLLSTILPSAYTMLYLSDPPKTNSLVSTSSVLNFQ